MKLFQQRELREALAFSAAGGQALHIISGRFGHSPGAPGVFHHQSEIAHLFDRNMVRLILTAKSLGVRVIKVERPGQEGMHVDLCRQPLANARDRCATPEML